MVKSVDVDALNSFILNQVIKNPKECDSTISDFRHKKQREHFTSLVKNITKESNGQAVLFPKEDAYTEFSVEIKPSGGPYVGGVYLFHFKLPVKYPFVAPHVFCGTDIYHPNIDDDGEICVSLIDDWCPEINTLLDCVQGLLFLMHHPNLDDPLNPNFSPGEFTDEEFRENIRKWMKGQLEGLI